MGSNTFRDVARTPASISICISVYRTRGGRLSAKVAVGEASYHDT